MDIKFKFSQIIFIAVICIVLIVICVSQLTNRVDEKESSTTTTTTTTSTTTTTTTTSPSSTTTTKTSTTSTTKPVTNSFYQYAKYRAPKAVPTDINKHGKLLMLLNNYNELPENYVWDLVYWSNGQAVDNAILNKSDFSIQAVDRSAYEPLKAMFKAAEEAGVPLNFYSGYRSIVRQNRNFNNYVNSFIDVGFSREEAISRTNTEIAYPGTSEHNVGLAIDILAKGSTDLTENFEKTPHFKWLMENAENYGFVLRYPKEKTKITEIIYEPWHYRYVGVEHAKKMNQLGLCLEEYIEYLES